MFKDPHLYPSKLRYVTITHDSDHDEAVTENELINDGINFNDFQYITITITA